MQRVNQHPHEAMKRIQIPLAQQLPPPASCSMHLGSNKMIPDLLWISKEQQQHPSTHAHPLKNTIRLNSTGVRHKFDGKQWRPLCQSPDGYECRNLAFRSSLCQKHFYKIHLFKRPYVKTGSSVGMPPLAIKRPLLHSYDHHDPYPHGIGNRHEDMCSEAREEDEDDSIQVLDNSGLMLIKRDSMESKMKSHPDFTYFTIDCEPQAEPDILEKTDTKSEPLPKMKRLDSTNNESVISNESESSSLNISISKVEESTRLGLPLLTRTEEKSLSHELITQLPADASLATAERMARRRACEIIMDNYSQHISAINITTEWFYDFLLRNPRVPIHFQSWFSLVKATLPSSEHLMDIKVWELGLVTRSVMPSSSTSTSSSSP